MPMTPSFFRLDTLVNKQLVSLLVGLALVPLAVAPAHAAYGDDPCKTVSKSDVAVALGSSVASAKTSPGGALAQECTFDGSGLKMVQVTAYRGNDAADAKTQYASLTSRMAKTFPGAAPIAGIGDDAMGIRSVVYVRKGTAVYVFDVNGRPGPETLARATGLAKATMPHVKAN